MGDVIRLPTGLERQIAHLDEHDRAKARQIARIHHQARALHDSMVMKHDKAMVDHCPMTGAMHETTKFALSQMIMEASRQWKDLVK